MEQKRKVTWWNVIGYASINFLGSGAQALISAFLMFFYTSLCGLSGVKAGMIFTVARLIDAVGNPIIGYISDNFGRTRLGKRFGRRRFFTLLGIPCILIIFPMLWRVGHGLGYYMTVNMIYEVVFTMVIVTGITLPAEMTQDSAEKTKLVAGKQYCGTIASTIATFIPGLLFARYGNQDPQAFFLTGVIYAVIIALSLVVMYSLTFERDPKDIVYKEDNNKGLAHIFVKMFTDIFSSMKIKAFRLHAAMMFLIGVYKNLAGGIFTYFVVYVLALSASTTAYISSFTTLVSLVALTAYVALAYKFGGPRTFRIAAVIIIASLAGYFGLSTMTGSEHLTLLLVILALINTAGKAGADYVPVFQLPFMADIDEAVTSERREGIYAGVNSLLSKVAAAIEGLVLGVGLDMFGFVAGAEVQSARAKQGILIITIAAPIILVGLTWIISLRLKLTKEKHKLLVDEVNRVKAGGNKADVTAEAKQAIEELTGWRYEECFGNNNVGYHDKKRKITA